MGTFLGGEKTHFLAGLAHHKIPSTRSIIMSLLSLRVLRGMYRTRLQSEDKLKPHFVKTAPTASSSALLTSSSSSTSSVFPSFTSSFSTSSTTHESKSRRKSRLTRKTHIERKATLTRSQELSRPDPILGYALGKAEVWDQSKLKSLLLDRKNVWGEVVKTGEAGAVGAAEGGEVVNALEAGEYVPQNYNFGLKAEDVTLLREVLPSVAAQRNLFDKLNNEQLMGVRASESLKAEEEKRDRLVRIMDLRNASSKGIHVENTRRIVEAFGSNAGDTGRPEVQG